MQGSSLTGRIPSFIFNMTSLKYIDLGYNALSGGLPPKINLPNLEEIVLNSNQLTGDIFSSLLDCGKVWHLQLRENHLTGSIPKRVGNMSHLTHIFLNDNKMAGWYIT